MFGAVCTIAAPTLQPAPIVVVRVALELGTLRVNRCPRITVLALRGLVGFILDRRRPFRCSVCSYDQSSLGVARSSLFFWASLPVLFSAVVLCFSAWVSLFWTSDFLQRQNGTAGSGP
jgi:hypothetical protein